MPSRPVPVQGSVHPRVQDLRIFLRKPGGRRGRGRAEDHLHGRLLHHIQEGVKKFVGVLPFPGFDLVPGKFRDADDPDARLQHPVQILSPQAPVPVLGIITGSQRQTVSIDDLSHVRSPSLFSQAILFQAPPPSLFFRRAPALSAAPGSFCCARLLLPLPESRRAGQHALSLHQAKPRMGYVSDLFPLDQVQKDTHAHGPLLLREKGDGGK